MIFLIIGLAMLAYGFASYRYPRRMWWWEVGRRTKEKEPAAWYLILHVYGGLIMLIFGLGLVLYSLFELVGNG